MERNVDFSNLMSETFDLLRDAARFVGLFVLVIGGLNAVGVILGLVQQTNRLASFGGGFMIEPGMGFAQIGFSLMVSIVTVVASYFLLSKLLGTRGLLGSGGTRIWAYVGMSILSAMGLIAGFILLIVPGLILLVRWSASAGFLLGAREGVTESLGASWRATDGHSWPIFFAGLVLLIGLTIVGGAIGAGIGASGSLEALAVFASLIDAFSSTLFFTFGIAVYSLVQSDVADVGEVFS